MTMTITEFLTARLDEDEAVARDVQGKTQASVGRHYEDAEGSAASAYFDSEYLQGGFTITAARALADITAKRAILAEFQSDPNALHSEWGLALEWVLRRQIQPYADRPDFDPSWRV